jgi:uncharacterized protein YifE (UPF0438 family)
MQDIKEFYILGLPIETPIGNCRFLKVKEYPDSFTQLNVIAITKDQIIQSYGNTETDKQIIELLKTMSLYEIVLCSDELRTVYVKAFAELFNDAEAFLKVTEKTFEYYRKLILDMNCIKEEKINPNPEIQKWIEKSKRFKQEQAGGLTFADLVTSVAIYAGVTYEQINELTIYQLYASFQRIAMFKSYDTSTLFSTVSVEKVNIESWCKHIDMFAEEEYGISKDQFFQLSNQLFF